jgi:hypothetical protein
MASTWLSLLLYDNHFMNDVDSAIMIMVQSPLSTAMPNSAWRETYIITHHSPFDSANIDDGHRDTVLQR